MWKVIVLHLFLICVFSLSAGAQVADENWKPGKIFKDCKSCPEMITVPRGMYIMGLGGKKHHGPPTRVIIDKAFAIGRYEVTFTEWFACVSEQGCQHQPDDHKWGANRRPVINITWTQAKNFIRWLRLKTGHKYRLPSEAEWEYSARAGTTTQFWWGDDPGNNMANCRDCESKICCSAKKHSCCSKSTRPVGSFPANQFGLYDTAGNVFEWTEDCWNKSHLNRPKTSNSRTRGDCSHRVIRGGSFYYFSRVARSHYRAKNPPDVKSYWLGFRVVRELE